MARQDAGELQRVSWCRNYTGSRNLRAQERINFTERKVAVQSVVVGIQILMRSSFRVRNVSCVAVGVS